MVDGDPGAARRVGGRRRPSRRSRSWARASAGCARAATSWPLHRDATSGGGAVARPRSGATSTASTRPSPATRSPTSPSWTASCSAAASGSPRTARTASSPSARGSACPRPASASSPTSAAPGCSRRAPGELGTHLALSGAMVGAGDAIALGLADALRSSPTSRDALLTALRETDADSALAAHAQLAPAAPLVQRQSELDAAYAGERRRASSSTGCAHPLTRTTARSPR